MKNIKNPPCSRRADWPASHPPAKAGYRTSALAESDFNKGGKEVFVDKVACALDNFDLPPGIKIVLAYSGGADSTALLYALHELQEKFGFALKAAHLNHMLRGEESFRDEMFVQKVCAKIDIPLTVRQSDIAALAKNRGQGLEQTGRDERYTFLRECAGDGLIATAHTKSDQMETVLLNLTRGTGIKGLCGIPARRDNIIRPLLDCTRDEIEAFCADRGIEYITDSTNADQAFARNRIRLSVIPALKQINPAAEQTAARLSRNLLPDEEFLEQTAATALAEATAGANSVSPAYSCATLRGLHESILRRVCRRLIARHCGVPADEKTTMSLAEFIRSPDSKKYTIYNIQFTIKNADLIILDAGANCVRPQNAWRCEFFEGFRELPCGNTQMIVINMEDFIKNKKIYKKHLNIYADYDKILGMPFLRSRTAGDKFHPAGRNVGKTLKKLFNEAAVPVHERNRVAVLCDDRGIVAVSGFGTDARAEADGQTRQILAVLIDDNNC